ncbi:MAG: alpha-amylase family glycosyl hydrolase, partial [Paracoccaceae bacterium]
CIYQGEELGLPEAQVAFEDLQDPYGIEFWPEFKGRDGCRTPMVWTESNQNGGFSTAGKTWLPVPSEHLRHSVAAAEADPASLLHHYRRVISFRHVHRSLMRGLMTEISADENVLQFLRSDGNENIFCAFNLSDEPAYVTLPKGKWVQIGQELNSAHAGADRIVNLGPWQPCLALKIGQ